MPPQQWPSVQSSTNQQMNMGYGLPSQQNTNIPPQQRGPPLSSNQAQTLDRLVLIYCCVLLVGPKDELITRVTACYLQSLMQDLKAGLEN